MVCTPICHDGIDVLEGAFAGQAGNEPSCRPGWIGALIENGMDFIGQGDRVALRELEDWANALDEVKADHRHRHFGLRFEVGGEAAAAEIAEVCRAPVGGRGHGFNIRVRHIPPLFHQVCTCFILADAGGVKRRRAGVDEVDKARCRRAFRCFARNALDRLRAPISAHICEYACCAGEELAKEHGKAV